MLKKIIHIYIGLMLNLEPRGFILEDKTNFAYAYWPEVGIFFGHFRMFLGIWPKLKILFGNSA
jgi:hypothetical protein